jgi:hypothetical protein
MNLVKKITLLALPAMLVLPLVVGAQGGTLTSAVDTILNFIKGSVIPAIFAIALVIFLWGIVSYMIAGDDEEKKKTGRTYIIYGIIGLAVMASVWGLVGLLTGEFHLGNVTPTMPEVPGA